MKKLLMLSTAIMIISGSAYAETIKASVNGLVCSFCATGIEKTFKKRPEVNSVHVDLNSKLVTVETNPDKKLDDATVTKLIEDAGYSVTKISREK